MVRHGIDLVTVARISELLNRHGERFLDRCFTAHERAYADGQTKRRAEHLAARFAAKEAVLKALGTGLADGISWTEIEVTRDGRGAPGVKLTGRAAKIAKRLGIAEWAISLSHTDELAMASVIARVVRRSPPDASSTLPSRSSGNVRRGPPDHPRTTRTTPAKRSSKRGSKRS